MKLLDTISICIAYIASASMADGPHDEQTPLGLSEESQSSHIIPSFKPDPDTLQRIQLDFSEKDSAAESNALLQYLASPEAPRDIIHEITVEGYPSLGNWTLLAEVFDQQTIIQDVHWNAFKAISKEILTPLEVKNPPPRLHYTIPFANWDPWDESVPTAQPVGQEHDHEVRSIAREAIIGSKVLHSLIANINYGGSPNHQDMDLVFRILSASSNLKELYLSISYSGCVVSDGQPTAFDFISNPDVRFPPLEVLSMEGYRFYADSSGSGDWDYIPYRSWEEKMERRGGWPWKWLPRFIMDGVHEVWNTFDFFKRDVQNIVQEQERGKKLDGKTSIDHWLMVMDWSHLHTLSLTGAMPQTLTKIRSQDLPSLKNITFISSDFHHAALEFIANSTVPLKSVSLRNMHLCSIRDAVDTISTHHGPSIKHLTIHDTETYQTFLTQSTAPSTVKSTDVAKLVTLYTKLQKLEFDLPRPPPANTSNIDDWQTESANMTRHQLPIFNLLATAPELQQLVLHYPSPDLRILEEEPMRTDWYQYGMRFYGSDDRDDIPDPFINKNSTQELFSYLRSKKVGKELESLEILVGDWENRHLPRQMMARSQKRIARYFCQIDENGREACDGYQTRNND